MALFEEEPVKRKKPHEIGQDLALLSLGELTERIALLKDEVARLEREIVAKGATRNAADALFRK